MRNVTVVEEFIARYKMAKRSAETQITKASSGLSHEDDVSDFQSGASVEVMRKRKILQPKGLKFSFSKEASDAAESEINSSPARRDKGQKLKALANSFVNAITNSSSQSQSQIPDYRIFAQKYIDYYESIEAASGRLRSPTEASAANNASVQAGNVEENTASVEALASFQQSSGETASVQKSSKSAKPLREKESESEDEKKDFKIQGPAFSLSTVPTSKTTVFSFEAKPKKPVNSVSDSDSDIEVKGPSFMFDKKIEDPVFKIAATKDDNSASCKQSENSKPSSENSQSSNIEAKSILQPSISSSTTGMVGSKAILTNAEAGAVASAGNPHSDEQNSRDQDQPLQNARNQIAAGGESEEVLLQVRAKLMLLRADNPSDPYQSLGVGELQVLKSNTHNSSRILLRADGGLRLLLNALLIKDVQYSTLGNGSYVRFPALDCNQQMVTYVFKLGSIDKGQKLSETLNAAK